jgi:hypothetical protein
VNRTALRLPQRELRCPPPSSLRGQACEHPRSRPHEGLTAPRVRPFPIAKGKHGLLGVRCFHLILQADDCWLGAASGKPDEPRQGDSGLPAHVPVAADLLVQQRLAGVFCLPNRGHAPPPQREREARSPNLCASVMAPSARLVLGLPPSYPELLRPRDQRAGKRGREQIGVRLSVWLAASPKGFR